MTAGAWSMSSRDHIHHVTHVTIEFVDIFYGIAATL